MALREMPKRLKEFLHWLEQDHPTEEVLQRIQDHLGQVHEEMDALQHEAKIVESLLGFLGEHHLPNHSGEPVRTRASFNVPKEERGQCILETAREIVKEGQLVVEPRDVVSKLTHDRLDLGVKYPTTVIGNVLARSPDFRRVARNRFEYVGRATTRRLTAPRGTRRRTAVAEGVRAQH
jgi:hypothetical protein